MQNCEVGWTLKRRNGESFKQVPVIWQIMDRVSRIQIHSDAQLANVCTAVLPLKSCCECAMTCNSLTYFDWQVIAYSTVQQSN
jgi:hypothetical protein